jgi:hypothetical protein
MKTNMGTTDRSFRIILAVITVIKGSFIDEWLLTAYVVASILLLTSLLGFSPLYAVFGVSTSPHKA